MVSNPPFRHRYNNPSQSTWPRVAAPRGHIEEVPEEPEKDSDEDPDQTPNPDPDPDHDPDPDPNPDPDPESKPEPEPEPIEVSMIKNLSQAIKGLAESVNKDPSDSKVKISDSDTFDGSDPKKLRGFCCSENSTSGPSISPSIQNNQRSTTCYPS